MKKLILTICFCLMTTLAYADHWVYIRLEDKSAMTSENDMGRSKAGDIVDIRLADYEPSEMEKKEWSIIKVSGLTKEDIVKYKKQWKGDIVAREATDEEKNLWTKTNSLNNKEAFNNFLKTLKDVPADKPQYIYEDIAYREYKIDVNGLQLKKGVDATLKQHSIIKNSITQKTALDIARYERKRKIYVALQPFRKLHGYITYAWEYWVRPAYAAVACADDTTDGEQVCTINLTAQDYDTITLWEDAKDGDLVAAGQIRTGAVYDDDGNLDESGIDIDGSTTDATHYMKLTAPVGERHDGTEDSGATIHPSTPAKIMDVNDLYTLIEWMEMENAQERFIYVHDPGRYSIIRNCIIHDKVADNTDMPGAIFATWDMYILNTIIKDLLDLDDGTVEAINLYSTTTNLVSNCSLTNIDSRYANYNAVEDATVTNTIVILADAGDEDCYANVAGDYNIGSDATAPGDNSLDNKTIADLFVSAADLHLKEGSDAIDVGDDLGTTNGVNFDIDNRDRDAEGDTWDIGADEYVAAAVEGGPPGLHLYDVVIY